MSTNLDNDDIDLSMRAPYIPMNENDDLPLLTEDLMWSAFSDELSLHKDMKDATLQQQLLLQQQQQHQQQLQTSYGAGAGLVVANSEIANKMLASPSENDGVVSSKYAASNGRSAKDASNIALLLSPNVYSTENDKQAALLSAELTQSQCRNGNNNNTKYEQTQYGNRNGNSNQNENANIKYQRQSAAKTVNAKSIRSHLPQQTATTSTATTTTTPIINNNNSASKMEVIDSVDGSITTYTIEMLDDDAYSKNCKCTVPEKPARIPKARHESWITGANVIFVFFLRHFNKLMNIFLFCRYKCSTDMDNDWSVAN